MGSTLHLRVFGRPELVGPSGEPLPFRTRKQLALLVVLTLEARERPTGREPLVEMLWPDVAAARGRHSLSQALTAIRTHLGMEAVSRGRDSVRFLAALPTQLDLLREGVEASADVEVPLEGLEDAAGAEFAHWVDRTRSRLRREAAAVLGKVMRDARSSGNAARVHECAVQLYRVDPLSDLAAQGLAEERLLNDDRAGALRVLRRHVERCRADLGCAPSRELSVLLRRLEAGTTRTPDGGPTLESDVPAREELFLGRESEVARLEAAWQRARRGGLVRLLAAGPAGIGKSTLVRRFAASVTARACPAWIVSCQEMGANIPFGALSEWVHALCGDPMVSGTDPRWLSEASRVTPGLRERYPGVPEPPDMPPEAVRLRVAEAVGHMVEAVADGGPALLVFDDIQHLDQASKDILHVLSRRLAGLPVLLAGTLRTHEGEGPKDGEPAVVEGFEWGPRIALAPLTVEAVDEVVAHLCREASAPEKAIRNRLAEVSQGNPYLVEMLVSDWRRNGDTALVAGREPGDLPRDWRPSDMMRAAFARQHERLSPDAMHLLQLLAVAGRRMPQPDAASLLGLAPAVITRAVLELVERGIVRAQGGVLGFKNDMHRAFAYYRLSEEVCTYLHARIAEVFSRADRAEDFQNLLEASHHYVRAGMGEEAAAAACTGAEVALRHGGVREAEKALRGALNAPEVGSRRRVEVLLATVLEAEGRYREVLEVVEECDPSECSPRDRAQRAVTLAATLLRGMLSGKTSAGVAAADAYCLALASGDRSLVYQSIHIKAELAAESGDVGGIQAIAKLVQEYSRDATDRQEQAMGALVQAACALFCGDPRRTLELCSTHIPTMEAASRPLEVRRLRTLEGNALWYLGKHAQAISSYEAGITVARELGDTAGISVCYSNLGLTFMELGNSEQALQYLIEARRLFALLDSPRRHAEALVNQAAVHISLGQLPEANDAISEAQGVAQATKSPRLTNLANSMEIDYHLACGNTEGAWLRMEELGSVHSSNALPISSGNSERQRRQFTWIRHGYAAFVSACEHDALWERRPVRDRLTLEALRAWLSAQEGVRVGQSASVLDELNAAGFRGTAAYLAQIGIS